MTQPFLSERARADVVLVRDSLRGQKRAVETLVERMRCIPRILAAKNRRLAQPLAPAELEDLVQETLTAVWRKLPAYDGRARLETWAYSFCLLELLHTLRAKSRRPAHLADEHLLPAEARPPVDRGGGVDDERVHASLARLDPADADVLRLKLFEDCTFREVGQRLELPVNTVKTRYYRALAKMRGRLSRKQPSGSESGRPPGRRPSPQTDPQTDPQADPLPESRSGPQRGESVR